MKNKKCIQQYSYACMYTQTHVCVCVCVCACVCAQSALETLYDIQ